MAETSQDPGAIRTYLSPWSKQLSQATAATGGTRTITSATVTASDGATVSNITPSASVGVMFRLNTSAVTGYPKDITVTVTPTLDNGDKDVRHHTIQVTNT